MQSVLQDFEQCGTATLLPSADVVVIGGDFGNSAGKLAVVGATGQVHLLRVPNAYLTAQRLQSGDTAMRHRVNGGTWRWYGEAALAPGRTPHSLVQGATAVRLDSSVQREFMAACIVDGLHKAGYQPGAYRVVMGLAVPTDEIERADQSGKIRVLASTRDAIKEHLVGQTWQVDTLLNEFPMRWTLHVESVRPQAQTLCAAIAMSRSALGESVIDRDGIDIYDLGHHDSQRARVLWRPSPSIQTNRLGDGVRMIAEELIQELGVQNSQAYATNFLFRPKRYVRGRWVDMRPDVQRITRDTADAMLQPIVEQIARSDQFVGFTGGGVALFRSYLANRLYNGAKQQLQAGEDYVLPSEQYAVYLNAVGAAMLTRFALSR